MIETKVDYTIFFRELSNIPKSIKGIEKSFYEAYNETIESKWNNWLEKWNLKLNLDSTEEELSKQMKLINPKYTLREWILVDAYKEAQNGNYKLVNELQEIMTNPYLEQSIEVENKYYNKKSSNFFGVAGVSHISCSS